MKTQATQTLKSETVVVVGMGCVLPQTRSTEDFWKHLISGQTTIRPIPNSRWKASLYVSDDPNAPDKTYSNYAAYIEDSEIAEIARDLNLPVEPYTRLQITSLAAAQQALEGRRLEGKKVDIFLGCMGNDEAFSLHTFLQEQSALEKYIDDHFESPQRDTLHFLLKQKFHSLRKKSKPIIASQITSSTTELIKQRFGLRGECALIDAACASSLAAIEFSMKQLQTGKADLVLTGGIEGQLAPEHFVLFSQIGLLSKKIPRPLDDSTDGMAQGEGAVLFVLQRLGEAVRDGHPIYGVLPTIGSASNGASASLFSPSLKGQSLALRKANDSLEKKRFNYIECHATGTRVGDMTELKALDKQFSGTSSEKIPLGSVKSIFGHTKGAAGAVSLLKCLLSLQHKTLPPSPYFKNFVKQIPIHHFYVNQAPVSLEKESDLRFGISSTGFGGANYHLVLESYLQGKTAPPPTLKTQSDIPLAGLAQATTKDPAIRQHISHLKLNIPPKHLDQIDAFQLQGLSAVATAFERTHTTPSSWPAEKVSVLSASILGLPAAQHFAKRIRHFELLDTHQEKKAMETLLRHKQKFASVNEDTGPGILNNVLAGRVCQTYGFQGKHFNIDADKNSTAIALQYAQLELESKESDLVILLRLDETIEENPFSIERESVTCFLLTRVQEAEQRKLSIQFFIENLEYSEQCLRKI